MFESVKNATVGSRHQSVWPIKVAEAALCLRAKKTGLHLIKASFVMVDLNGTSFTQGLP